MEPHSFHYSVCEAYHKCNQKHAASAVADHLCSLCLRSCKSPWVTVWSIRFTSRCCFWHCCSCSSSSCLDVWLASGAAANMTDKYKYKDKSWALKVHYRQQQKKKKKHHVFQMLPETKAKKQIRITFAFLSYFKCWERQMQPYYNQFSYNKLI